MNQVGRYIGIELLGQLKRVFLGYPIGQQSKNIKLEPRAKGPHRFRVGYLDAISLKYKWPPSRSAGCYGRDVKHGLIQSSQARRPNL